MFDTGPDTITVRKLGAKLPTVQQIEQHHVARIKTIGIEYPIDRYISARDQFIAAHRKLKGNSTSTKLRSLRDHNLAHNMEPKTEPEKATLNDLLDLTEAVTDLVDLAGYILKSSQGVYRDISRRSEEATKKLYAALPALATAENKQN